MNEMSVAVADPNALVDSVLAEIRAGLFPDGNRAAMLDRLPFIDLLRDRTQLSDVPLLIAAMRESDERSAGLAVSILRRYGNDQNVRDAFDERWSVEESPYLKNRLMWRLLDREHIDARLLDGFEKFISDNWGAFADFNRSFFGTSDVALGRLLLRLIDISFPTSKKWIYLCCAPTVIDDSRQLRTLLNAGESLCGEGYSRAARVLAGQGIV